MEDLKDVACTYAMAHIKDIVDEAKLNANREAKKIIIQSIQRVAHEQTVENAVSVFNIDSDEVKGRIIGREGRNIDRKSTRLNSSHVRISYAVFCLKKK